MLLLEMLSTLRILLSVSLLMLAASNNSTTELGRLLVGVGLSLEFETTFAEHGIDTLSDLSLMQSHDLLELGVDKLSDRLALLRAVKRHGATRIIDQNAPIQGM